MDSSSDNFSYHCKCCQQKILTILSLLQGKVLGTHNHFLSTLIRGVKTDFNCLVDPIFIMVMVNYAAKKVIQHGFVLLLKNKGRMHLLVHSTQLCNSCGRGLLLKSTATKSISNSRHSWCFSNLLFSLQLNHGLRFIPSHYQQLAQSLSSFWLWWRNCRWKW